MSDKEKLQELAEAGESLIMLGEAIRNWARKGDQVQAVVCLQAAKICAPELIGQCAQKIGVSLE